MIDEELRRAERRAREGSASEVEVAALDRRRVLAGAWDAALLRREVGRIAGRAFSPERLERGLAYARLRELVLEASACTHWVRAVVLNGVESRQRSFAQGERLCRVSARPGAQLVLWRLTCDCPSSGWVRVLGVGPDGSRQVAVWRIDNPQGGASLDVDALHLIFGRDEAIEAEVATEILAGTPRLLLTFFEREDPVYGVVAVEPDQACLAVTKVAPFFRGVPLAEGGWDFRVTRWIDAPREDGVLAPRSVAEEWARLEVR